MNKKDFKMIKQLLTLTILLFGLKSFSQDFNKTILQTSDPNWLHTNDGDSDTLFYLNLTPKNYNETILILMPGWHAKPEEIPLKTKLPYEVLKNGISTLIPSINTRVHYDTACFEFINNMILDYSKKKNLEVKNVIVGGLSAGGIV